MLLIFVLGQLYEIRIIFNPSVVADGWEFVQR